ncbi:hypothetical protein EON65_03640, partial [archaeon]
MSQKITFVSLLACSLVYSAPESITGSRRTAILPEHTTVQQVTEESLHDGKDIIFFPVRLRAYPLHKRRHNLYGTPTPMLWHCEGCKDTNPLNPHLSCPAPYMYLGERRKADIERYPADDGIMSVVQDTVIGVKDADLVEVTEETEEEVLDFEVASPLS